MRNNHRVLNDGAFQKIGVFLLQEARMNLKHTLLTNRSAFAQLSAYQGDLETCHEM